MASFGGTLYKKGHEYVLFLYRYKNTVNFYDLELRIDVIFENLKRKIFTS